MTPLLLRQHRWNLFSPSKAIHLLLFFLHISNNAYSFSFSRGKVGSFTHCQDQNRLQLASQLNAMKTKSQGGSRHGQNDNQKQTKKKTVSGPTLGGKPRTTSKNNKQTSDLLGKTTKTTSQQNMIFLPSTKSKSPPWKVLSPKEMKKHVEMEIQRRGQEKKGIVAEATSSSSSNSATTDNKIVTKKILSSSLLSHVDQQLIGWKRFNPYGSNGGVGGGLMFMGAYLDKRLPPRLGVPEIAFLGRSNVGKSSLLNKLVYSASISGQKSSGGITNSNDFARVGKTPGATASVNLYAMMGTKRNKKKQSSPNGASVSTETKPILGLVDLPGFGYAKLSKQVQESVQMTAERYLDNREELALAILLVDARRVPSDDDRAILAALYDMGIPLVVVATKIDKLTKNEQPLSQKLICDRLGLPPGQPLFVSSSTGEGIKELWKIIMDACEIRVDEIRNDRQCSGMENDEGVDVDDDGGSVEFDEYGNEIPVDNFDEEPVYSQGYDWIQDAVMYEYGDGDINDQGLNESEAGSRDDQNALNGEALKQKRGTLPPTQGLSFKSLTKLARRMEERGEV